MQFRKGPRAFDEVRQKRQAPAERAERRGAELGVAFPRHSDERQRASLRHHIPPSGRQTPVKVRPDEQKHSFARSRAQKRTESLENRRPRAGALKCVRDPYNPVPYVIAQPHVKYSYPHLELRSDGATLRSRPRPSRGKERPGLVAR